MRALLQRVTKASVTVSGETVGSIDQGLLVLLGVGEDDTQEDIDWLVRKIVNMRIFSDENGHMNRSVIDIKGAILVVSQFTLHASTKKGNRPSFIRAATPDVANSMYETTVNQLLNNLKILKNEVDRVYEPKKKFIVKKSKKATGEADIMDEVL